MSLINLKNPMTLRASRRAARSLYSLTPRVARALGALLLLLSCWAQAPKAAWAQACQCEQEAQKALQAWVDDQSFENFEKMTDAGMKNAVHHINELVKNQQTVDEAHKNDVTNQKVTEQISENMQIHINKKLKPLGCPVMTTDNLTRSLKYSINQDGQLKEEASATLLGASGVAGGALTAGALAAYAVLTTGFWGTLWAGGATAVAIGALVPEPMTIAIITGGAGLLAGGFYLWKKKAHKESKRSYIVQVQAAVTNKIRAQIISRALSGPLCR